jgi:hypothetical protein
VFARRLRRDLLSGVDLGPCERMTKQGFMLLMSDPMHLTIDPGRYSLASRGFFISSRGGWIAFQRMRQKPLVTARSLTLTRTGEITSTWGQQLLSFPSAPLNTNLSERRQSRRYNQDLALTSVDGANQENLCSTTKPDLGLIEISQWVIRQPHIRRQDQTNGERPFTSHGEEFWWTTAGLSSRT